MGTVISFTAERMLEVEGSSIVRGYIDMDGHLILTARDGRVFDAGYVGIAGPHNHAIGDVDTLEETLTESASKVALVENTVNQIQNGTLPELQEAIEIAQATADSTVKVHFEADLGPGVYPTLNDTSDLGDLYYRTDGQVERWMGSTKTPPWVLVEDTVLAETIAALRDAEEQLNTLNTVTLPNLQDELDAAELTIAQHTTDLTGLDGRLNTAETAVSDANSAIDTLNTVDLPYLNTELGKKLNDLPGVITETLISDDAVVTSKIAANAVTANEIAANSVTADEIAANTITANEIAADTITANEIAADAVTANEIATNAVTAGKIDAGAVTAREVASYSITAEKLIVGSFGNLIPASEDLKVSRGAFPAELDWGWNSNDPSVWLEGSKNRQSLPFTLNAGDKLRVSVDARTSVAGDRLYLGIQRQGVYTSAPASGGLPWAISNVALTTAYASYSGIVDITETRSDYTFTALAQYGKGSQTGHTWFRYPRVRSMIGTLIEDGAITTNKILAGAVTASEMKAGTITAASGILADAVITSAKIADLAVTNAKVEGISAKKITTDTLGADRIGARTITVDKLLVGDFENLFADIAWDTGTTAPHTQGFGASAFNVQPADATPDASGTQMPQHLYAYSLAEGTNLYLVNWAGANGQFQIPVKPNTQYRVSTLIRSGGNLPNGHGAHGWVVRERDAARDQVTFRGFGSYFWLNWDWREHAEIFVTGPTTHYVELYSRTTTNSAGFRFMSPYLRPLLGGQVIVDGGITTVKLDAGAVTAEKIDANAVTADKIAANAVTATKIDAQAVTSDKITVNALTGKTLEASAFRVFDAEGAPVINFSGLASDSSEMLATFGNGAKQATIAADGSISGSLGNFETLTIGGELLTDIVDSLSRGVVARASFGQFRGDFSTTTEQGITELRFRTPPGPKREYRIQASNLGVAGASSSGVRFRIRMTMDGTRPSTSSTDYVIWEVAAATTDQSGDFSREYAFDGDTDVRMLLTISPRSGTGYWQTRQGTELSVIDEGLYVERTGVAVIGSTATSDPTQKYVKTYTSNWSQSYMGSNAQRSGGDGGKCYQGQTPYWTPGGIQRSLIGFPTQLQTDLAGATISKLEVYLYFEHWHAGSGGVACIGLHTHASKPTSFTHSVASAVESGNWPRGGGRWVTIPSTYYNSFKAGTYKGISLYKASTSTAYYGYASGAGSAKFRATYSK